MEPTSNLASAVTLLICIEFGRDTKIITKIFRGFSRSNLVNVVYYLKLGYCYFRSLPCQFIIQQLSFNSAL
jgi:hypothetical protein